MSFFRRGKKKVVSDDQVNAGKPLRSREEILALLQQKRQEVMEQLTSEEALLELLHAKGWDERVDFKLNEDYCCFGSVRLNRQADGSYLLYTVGERGIDSREIFQEPKEAYYAAYLAVGQMWDLQSRYAGR